MDAKSILTPDPTKLSSPRPTVPQKTFLRPSKPRSTLPDAELSESLVENGGDKQENEVATGGACQSGYAPPHFLGTPRWYTRVETDSTRALTQTLKEVRGLRDELLRQDERSTDALLLAQVGLVLERIQRDIPSGREAFLAVLRAARLPEPTPEAVEA